MTVKLLDTGMNQTLVEKLYRLSENVKSLSSENFEKISPALVDLERKLEAINFSYAGYCMVNSVDAYKIDKMIAHLKTSAKQFLFVEKEGIVIPVDETGQSAPDGAFDVEVPSGYSGFNSIVLPFGIMAVPYSFKNSGTKKNSMVWYTKNDRTIRFEWQNLMREQEDFLPMAGDVSGYTRNYVSILFWR